jgi:hypothetical protein
MRTRATLIGAVALAALVAAVAYALAASPSKHEATAPAGARAPAVARTQATRGPAAAGSRSSTPAAGPPCGAAAPVVLANAAGSVAQRIYASEARSSETESDKRQVEGYGPLLSAVRNGEHAAIEAAVHGLVYSHTHIVRLRVSSGSRVLADIGGPYILAPVSGTLRSNGRTIARFVFSVQDDLGYVKLVTRFTGAPLILRTDSGQVPVPGQLSPGPAKIPDRGAVSYRGRSYQAYSFNARAYPSGRLRVSLLLAIAPGLSKQTCAAVNAQELALVAQRISRRFSLSRSTFAPYIRLVHTMTDALVYVRAGGRTLAGSTRSTPPRLPSTGALRWRGVSYEARSFHAPSSLGRVGVFVLVAG